MKWWGTFRFDDDTTGLWRVGPLHLTARRTRVEWRLEYVIREDDIATGASVEYPTSQRLDGSGITRGRFSFDEAPSRIDIAPALADRPTVIYPEEPFYVTSGQHITLFCSTPLWVRVVVGGEGVQLIDIPSYRPPDTWFGPSTQSGELCYATRTAARLRQADLPVRAYRAVTPLHIHNKGGDTLHLASVNLSAPHLSLYSDPDGRFWTDTVTLTRTSTGALGELAIEGEPRGMALTAVAGPRTPTAGPNVVVRAFAALFD